MDKALQYSLSNVYKKARELYGNSPIAAPIAKFQADNRQKYSNFNQNRQVPLKVADPIMGFGQEFIKGQVAFTGLENKIPGNPNYQIKTPAGRVAGFAGGAVGYALGAGKLLNPVTKAIQGAVALPQVTRSAPIVNRAINYVARKTAPALIAEAANAVPTSVIQSKIENSPLLPTYAQNLAGGVGGRVVGKGIDVAAPLVKKAGKLAVKQTKEAVKKTDAEMFNRFINLAIDEGDNITSRLGSQIRDSVGKYGKKQPLIRAVGSGDVLDKNIPLLKLVFEEGQQPQGIGSIIPASKLKEMPQLAQFVQGPANPAAERLYKQAYSGGYVDLTGFQSKRELPKPEYDSEIPTTSSLPSQVIRPGYRAEPLLHERNLVENPLLTPLRPNGIGGSVPTSQPGQVNQLPQVFSPIPTNSSLGDEIDTLMGKGRTGMKSQTQIVPEQAFDRKQSQMQPLQPSQGRGSIGLLESSFPNNSTNTLKAGESQLPQSQTPLVPQTEANLQKFPPRKSMPSNQEIKGSDFSQTNSVFQDTSSVQTRSESKGVVSEGQASPYFNTKTYKITDEGKKVVEQAIDQAKPQMEKFVGKTLSNKEALQLADTSSKTLNKAVGRDQTLEWEAALLKARQKLAALSEKGTVDKEYIDTLSTIKSLGTDIGRKLQSFSIGADPKLLTSKQAILEAVLKATDDADAVLKAAQGVDFNDLNQATVFYRQFIKPSRGEKLDLLRYNSMLSSPNTHINNISSNFQGTGLIAPVEKTITGGLDALKSALTGKPREYAIGEGAAYAKGYYSNVGKAVKNFTDVMSGKMLMENPDIRDIQMFPKGGPLGRIETTLKYPMKLLEATDQFFTALTEGGEVAAQKLKQSKGIKLKGLSPEDAAAKRLFRSKIGDNNDSAILDAIDSVANKVQSMKNDKNQIVRIISKLSLPFLKTPTNILKQGLEYSPLGAVTTPWGSKTKTEQFSKAILGTSVAVGVAQLIGSDRLTWAEPTGEKQKQAFKAAGMQPYAVKVGDNWISYSKLHPAISFNFALVAAVKDAQDKKLLDDGQSETVLNGLAKWLQFYTDQSYLKNIGDIIATNQGDIEGPARLASNYAQQGIPFRALMGWVARLTDPYQRKVDKDGSFLDKQLQQLSTQIPLVSQTVPTRNDMFDNPIPNQNRVLNAVSPAKVTTEMPEAKGEYDFLREKSKMERESQQLKDQFEREARDNTTVQKVGAAEDTYVEGAGIAETGDGVYIQGEKVPMQLKYSQPLDSREKERIGTYIKYGKSLPEIDLINYFYGDIKAEGSKTSPYQQALRQEEVMARIKKVEDNELLSQVQKDLLITRGLGDLGITPQDYEYYKLSKQNSELKALYANEQLSKLMSTPGTTPSTINNWLVNGRKTINGEQLLNDAVIKSLIDNGVIGKEDGAYLKKITVQDGKVKITQSIKKPKKLRMPKLKKIKIKKQKQIKLKPISLKLKKIKLKKT